MLGVTEPCSHLGWKRASGSPSPSTKPRPLVPHPRTSFTPPGMQLPSSDRAQRIPAHPKTPAVPTGIQLSSSDPQQPLWQSPLLPSASPGLPASWLCRQTSLLVTRLPWVVGDTLVTGAAVVVTVSDRG